MSAQVYYMFLAKLNGKRRPFWIEPAEINPLNYLLHVWVILTILKVCQTERRRPFWIGQTEINPLNYLLHVEVILAIIKLFIILFLLCLWE